MDDPVFKVPKTVSHEETPTELTVTEAENAPEVTAESGAVVAEEDERSLPPVGIFRLETVKNGTVVDSLNVTKAIISFGRSRECDFPMDHPSISRYHAVLTWKPGPSKWGIFYLKDLDSTHGSYVNKKRIPTGLVARIEPNNSIFKFGGSSRNYILNSVVDLEEETAADGEAASEEADQEVQETDPEVLYEQFMSLVMNPSTVASKNEHVFSENPHRVLQQWFEREGLEFEYNVSQHGNKFKCSVEIPIEGRDVRIEGKEPQSRKKDAIDHVCLIACRVLDQTLRLFPWQTNRKAKKRIHNSDDDDDDVLDETTETRNKRSRKRGSSEKSAETFESLMEKWNEVNEQLASCKADLVTMLSQGKQAAPSASGPDFDDLDSFMESLSGSESKHHLKIRQSQLKLKIKDLEKKQRVYELLIKAAKPSSLPAPAESPVTEVPLQISKDTPEPVAEKVSTMEETNDLTVKVTIKPVTTPAPLMSRPAAVFSDDTDVPDVATRSESSTSPSTGPIVSSSKVHPIPVAESDASPSKKKEKAKTTASKREKAYEDDFVDWCPPIGQDGSGKTGLNDKLGY